VLILPLLIEGEVAGSLLLGAAERHPFAAGEVELARRVAEQVSGALARARLEETHRRLTTAVEQAAEAVVITDIAGTILYANPAFEQSSGYSAADALGQHFRFLRSSKHDAAFYREMWQTLAGGRVWQGRMVNQKKGGSLYTADAVITPVHNQAGEIVSYVATMRDVTHEVELEEQFRQAQKMEAIGRLAGGVAHDFNNLLTIIHLSTRLLERKLSLESPLWPHVQRIREAGERATGLTRRLLAFSRQEAIEPKVLSLNDVVSNISKMLQRIIGEDVELTTSLAEGLWPVYADSTQIEQVILNLAVNARDAMPQGGTVTIETANVTLDETYTGQHLDVEPGEYVRLSISDTGSGMDDEVKKHLFEPFFTTKEKGKGTGLGLPIVFGAVKQNEGHVWVYSEVGLGTTFKIYLPRSEKAEAPLVARAHVRSPSLPPGGTETVLLVEDEAGVRELAAQILGAQGYQVLTAANGSEALRISGEHDGPIHLLLTDLVMPQMSGKELAEQLGSRRPEMRVLYMSGYTEDGIVQRRVIAGQVAFLSKPLTEESLIEKVRAVLDNGT
jgi:two-component system cell cycle sensor histidine kinase/response regulator CckA